MTLTLENDLFSNSDNKYTNGLGLSWVSNAMDTFDECSFVRLWGEFWSFLPFVGNDGYRTYVSWSVAQEMHTPNDIKDPNPPVDDQPYAGVLYLDNNLGQTYYTKTFATKRERSEFGTLSLSWYF